MGNRPSSEDGAKVLIEVGGRAGLENVCQCSSVSTSI